MLQSPELLTLSAVRAIVEVALFSLVAQGVIGLMAGDRRAENPIYQLFGIVTCPVIKLMRWLTCRLVGDRHLPFVAGLVLFSAWIFLAWLKRSLAT